MKQHLAVSAIGGDRTGMVHELTRVISECGGNISESRMASLGTEFAMLLLVYRSVSALLVPLAGGASSMAPLPPPCVELGR